MQAINGYLLRTQEYYDAFHLEYSSGLHFGRYDERARKWLYIAEIRWSKLGEVGNLDAELVVQGKSLIMLSLYPEIFGFIGRMVEKYGDHTLPLTSVISILESLGFVNVA